MVGTGQIQVFSQQSLQLKVQDGWVLQELKMQDTDSFLDRQNKQPWSVESSKEVPNGEVRTK
jgi:hypothetical protein